MATPPTRKPATKRKAAAPKPAETAETAPPAAEAAAPPAPKRRGRPPKSAAPAAATPKAAPAKRAGTAVRPRAAKPLVKPVATKAKSAPAKAVASVAAAGAKTVKRAKAAVAAIPTPEITPRQAVVVAAGTGGVIAAIGAAVFLWRASKADQPDYRLVERDGDFEIREYPALVTAATEARGPRDAALERGFRTLADYIFAKSRSGDKIAMTAPVLSDGDGKHGWRTRFIMPAGKARADLPTPPAGVTLASEPPRRVGAVRFTGRARDPLLREKEGALRSWLQLKSLPSEAKAEHAFYNSPMMPGPLRRNEVLVPLSSG